MGLSGDFGALAKLQAKIVRTQVIPSKVARAVAPKLDTTMRNTFSAKANLYGDPWAPISPRTIARGSKSAGVRSGDLLGAIAAKPQGPKIRVELGKPYGKYLIARGASPYPKGRLPPSWDPLLESEVAAAFREALL